MRSPTAPHLITPDPDSTSMAADGRGAAQLRRSLLAVTATLALLVGTTAPLAAAAAPSPSASAGNGVAAWGYNFYGQVTVPAGSTDVTAISVGPLSLTVAAHVAEYRSKKRRSS